MCTSRVLVQGPEALLSTQALPKVPGKQQITAQVLGPLPLTGESWVEFLALGPALAVVAIWTVNQEMEDFPPTLPFKQKKRKL